MSGIPPRERMKIPRQKMPEMQPAERVCSFSEVSLGFTEELARMEADRCLQCPKPVCIEGCPVGIKINDFIRLITEGKLLEAAAKIKEDSVLPAVCGSVCPQEEQCEQKCVVGKKGEPVAIGRLERFVADYERRVTGLRLMTPVAKTGFRIAIVGSGPA